MPTAIVTGATGILGRAIVQQLSASPQTWTSIHTLSRSRKEEYPSNVKHAHVNLTTSAQQIAKEIQGIEGEYLFFSAYVQKDTEQENSDVNGALLQNFLEALHITGAEKRLKRVILVAGAKQYGVHLGETKQPCEESDPLVIGDDRPPNFYYTQEQILKDASHGKGWDWVVTFPNDVIGFAVGNFMNLCTSLALYATVTRELGEDFYFPGCERFYRGLDSFTSSKLHAQFVEWAALDPKCGNQMFNVVNGDVQSWQTLWPRVARRFGCLIPADQFARPAPLPSSFPLADRPPLFDYAATAGLAGRVKQSVVELRVDLVKWSKRPEVRKAWEKVADRNGLDKTSFDKATWFFLGFVLGRPYDTVISMSKARKFGWTGYQDSWDAFQEVFDQLEKEKIIPVSRA